MDDSVQRLTQVANLLRSMTARELNVVFGWVDTLLKKIPDPESNKGEEWKQTSRMSLDVLIHSKHLNDGSEEKNRILEKLEDVRLNLSLGLFGTKQELDEELEKIIPIQCNPPSGVDTTAGLGSSSHE